MMTKRLSSMGVASIGLLAALLAMVLVACGQDVDVGIPTASEGQGATPAATSPTPTPVEPEDAALAYAQCIRDNGYPEWPDPGAQGYRITREMGIDRSDPRLQAAMEACQDLRPAGLGTGGLGGGQGLDNEEAAFAFARCMRENGFPDFPDPSAGGGVMVRSDVGIDPNDPKFQAARQTCMAHLRGEAD